MNQEISQGLERLFTRALSQAEKQGVQELCRTKNEGFIDRYLKHCQLMVITEFRKSMEEFCYKLDSLEQELE